MRQQSFGKGKTESLLSQVCFFSISLPLVGFSELWGIASTTALCSEEGVWVAWAGNQHVAWQQLGRELACSEWPLACAERGCLFAAQQTSWACHCYPGVPSAFPHSLLFPGSQVFFLVPPLSGEQPHPDSPAVASWERQAWEIRCSDPYSPLALAWFQVWNSSHEFVWNFGGITAWSPGFQCCC